MRLYFTIKVCQSRFTLGMRKYVLMERIIKCCNRLPKEVLESRSLGVFKRHLSRCDI